MTANRLVGLIEDEEIFRRFFTESVQASGSAVSVLTWSSAEEFLEDTASPDMDIIFIDIRLPLMNGISLITHLNNTMPDIPKLVITSVNSDEVIFRALEAGAVGYLYKEEITDICQVIKQVLAGGAVISPSIALRVLKSFKKETTDTSYESLSIREKQVLELLVQGLPVKKAAAVLNISANTLRNHVFSIYKKLNVRSKSELMLKASKIGLLP